MFTASTVDAIHFHEVGQVDAVLDVAGVCVALELLGVERVMCSPFPLGRGSIAMHHGRYPNPPPATAELLRGAPTQPLDVEGELVTTTAAAILTTLVTDPGVRPADALRADRLRRGPQRLLRFPTSRGSSIGELDRSAPTVPRTHAAAGELDDRRRRRARNEHRRYDPASVRAGDRTHFRRRRARRLDDADRHEEAAAGGAAQSALAPSAGGDRVRAGDAARNDRASACACAASRASRCRAPSCAG